jgi:hypothetical protein
MAVLVSDPGGPLTMNVTDIPILSILIFLPLLARS